MTRRNPTSPRRGARIRDFFKRLLVLCRGDTHEISLWLDELGISFRLLSRQKKGYLGVWMVVFVMVVLQMTTTIRPIVGTADTILPSEKRFFVAHWLETMAGRETKVTR